MSVAVVKKTFCILEALANAGSSLPLKEIAHHTALPKPTVHRLLRTLYDLGFVVEDSERGHYALGPRFIQVFRGDAYEELKRLARPLMSSIYRRFNETVNLAVLEGTLVHYLDVIETTQPLRWVVHPDQSDPFDRTALGRAIVAFFPEEKQEQMMEKAAARKRGIPVEKLRPILRKIARQGWAWDDEENDAGVVCLAVPLLDNGHAVAAISISLPKLRMNDQLRANMAGVLMDARKSFIRSTQKTTHNE